MMRTVSIAVRQGGRSRREQHLFEGLGYCDVLPPHCVFDQLGGLDYPFCAAPLASRGAWTLAVFSGGARTARLGGRDHRRRTRTCGLASILSAGHPPRTISMGHYRDCRATDRLSNTGRDCHHLPSAPRFVLSPYTADFSGTDLRSVSCGFG